MVEISLHLLPELHLFQDHNMLRPGTPPSKAKILEINLISAQDLFYPVSRKPSSMQAYVVAYINPEEKVVSRINTTDKANPTWNYRFVFMVDKEFMSARPHASVVFEIYKVRPKGLFGRKDKKIGVVHVLLDNLLNKREEAVCGEGSFRGIGNRCFAFHVRNPFGEPQGILNIRAASLDCAFGYRKLSGRDADSEEKKLAIEHSSDSTANQSCFGLCMSVAANPSKIFRNQ